MEEEQKGLPPEWLVVEWTREKQKRTQSVPVS